MMQIVNSVADLRAAIVQTASPTLMPDYSPRDEGAGLVQAQAAVSTQAVWPVSAPPTSAARARLTQEKNIATAPRVRDTKRLIW